MNIKPALLLLLIICYFSARHSPLINKGLDWATVERIIYKTFIVLELK